MFTVFGGGLNARVGDGETLYLVVFVFHSPSLGRVECTVFLTPVMCTYQDIGCQE